jgi:hypothetical protein
MKTKGVVKSVGYGEMILASIGTGTLMHCFVHAPQSMPALIRGTLGQLVDPHFPGKASAIRQGKMKQTSVSFATPTPSTTPPPLKKKKKEDSDLGPEMIGPTGNLTDGKIHYFGILGQETHIPGSSPSSN